MSTRWMRREGERGRDCLQPEEEAKRRNLLEGWRWRKQGWRRRRPPVSSPRGHLLLLGGRKSSFENSDERLKPSGNIFSPKHLQNFVKRKQRWRIHLLLLGGGKKNLSGIQVLCSLLVLMSEIEAAFRTYTPKHLHKTTLRNGFTWIQKYINYVLIWAKYYYCNFESAAMKYDGSVLFWGRIRWLGLVRIMYWQWIDETAGTLFRNTSGCPLGIAQRNVN